MKRVIVLILCLISFWGFIGSAQASDKMIVYVFTKDKEEICGKALDYLEALKEELEYFDYKEIIVWDENWKEDANNRKLVDKVSNYFGKDEVLGAPIIVVGNHYFDEYSQEMEQEIKNAVMIERENENYEDVVALMKDSLIKEKEHNKILTYILLFGLVVGTGAVIYFARKDIKKDSN